MLSEKEYYYYKINKNYQFWKLNKKKSINNIF